MKKKTINRKLEKMKIGRKVKLICGFFAITIVFILLGNISDVSAEQIDRSKENSISLQKTSLKDKTSKILFDFELEANKIYQIDNISNSFAYITGDTQSSKAYDFVAYDKNGKISCYDANYAGSFIVYSGCKLIIKTKSELRFMPSVEHLNRIICHEIEEYPLEKVMLKSGCNYRIENKSDKSSIKLENGDYLYNKCNIIYYSPESGYKNGNIIETDPDDETLILNSCDEIQIEKSGHALVQVKKGKNIELYYPKELKSQIEIKQYKGNMPKINTITNQVEYKSKFDPLKIVTSDDKEDGNLTSKIKVIKSNVDTSKIGVYNVTYSVTDSDKNTEYITVKVEVLSPLKATNNVKVVNTNYNTNKINWSKVNKSHGYVLYRATSKNGVYSPVKNIKSGAILSYTNTNLKTGQTYYYKVRPYRVTIDGKKVYGNYSSIVSAKPTLSRPSIRVTAGTNKAIIKWNKVSGASGYEVKRSNSNSDKYITVSNITKNSNIPYTNSKLTRGKTYYYKVRAYRTIDGKKVYSSYSTVKSIKVK